jgi:8-oxo-dGTP pyrophosphatase MutT (NUDIX family)
MKGKHTMLDPTVEAEIDALSQRFGTPQRQIASIANEGVFDPLGKPDRYGEVCMVVRRRNGLLLTARKTFYPADAYRLLTGGIHLGEPILEALLRETEEETGLDVAVRRFLAVVGYELQHTGSSAPRAPRRHAFHTFAFLLDEIGGTLACYDPDERVEDFREIAVDDLPQLANTLDRLGQGYDPEINGRWRDWGRFRAVIHRAVYHALQHDGA